MSRKLSDITHAFERSTEALEDAQDALTQATETARVKVDCAAKDRHQAYDALYAYLRDHGDEVVVAGDWGYRQERGQIARMKVTWAHHVYVEDPPAGPRDSRKQIGPRHDPAMDDLPCYRVPPATNQAALTAMATAWGDVEPRAGEAVGELITTGSQED